MIETNTHISTTQLNSSQDTGLQPGKEIYINKHKIFISNATGICGKNFFGE